MSVLGFLHVMIHILLCQKDEEISHLFVLCNNEAQLLQLDNDILSERLFPAYRLFLHRKDCVITSIGWMS